MNSPSGDDIDELNRALFTDAPEGLLVIDQAGQLLDVNEAACTMTGYERPYLLDATLATLFPTDLPPFTAKAQPFALHQKDGRFLPVSVDIRPLANGRFLTTLRDITEQQQAQQEIGHLAETLNTVNNLAIKLNELLTAVEPAKYIATIIRDIPGVFTVSVSSYQPQTRELVVEHLEIPQAANGILLRINKIIGRSIVGMRISVSDEMYERMHKEMITTVGTLHEITMGEIPKAVSAMAHRTFKIDKVYGLALIDNDELLGTIAIAMHKGAEVLTESMRLMLSRVCAVALRRSLFQKDLLVSEAKFRSYIDHAPLGILVVDENGRYLETNPAATQMLGYTEAEFLNITIAEIVDPEFLPLSQADFQTMINTGAATGEYRLRRKDNGTLWANVQSVRLGNNRFMAFVQDITARKQAEKSSQIKDHLLSITGQMAQVGGWEFDTDTFAGTWTDEVANIHDLDPNLETNVNFALSFYTKEAQQEIEQAVQELIEQGKSYDLELPIVSAKGIHKWVRTMGIPIWQDGKVVKARGIFQDITERKQAEQILGQQLQLQHQVTQIAATVPGMICSFKLAPDGTITMPFTSAALDEVYGLPAAALAENSAIIFDIMHPEDKERVLASINKSAQTMQPWRDEYRITHPRKGERWIEGHSVPQKEADGAILWHGFLQDITERKNAEEAQAKLEDRLRQSQKMESIGRLAGGVAHDFNNLLTVIQMYSDLMHSQMDKTSPLLPKLEQIQQASQRATALTRQLLAFSRKQILTPTRLDLNELVANLQKLFTRLIGEDINLSTALQDELWPILADAGQLEQVIMNLVINARDAMPTGGMLTIETGNILLEENLISSQLQSPVGPHVLLAITDTGHGMDETTRQHIFEPFFTTKQKGRGTGLGLATVHGIIRQSGGSIFVYSEPGQGTTFKIYLPASNGDTEQSSPQTSVQIVVQTGNETILLVEDEEAVRQLVQATLEELGYTVLAALDGIEALALEEAFEGQIDLLLTDVVMPQMSGRELAEQLRAKKPTLKLIFMSGYMDDAVVRHGILTAEVDFLPKPFSSHALATKIREVLDN